MNSDGRGFADRFKTPDLLEKLVLGKNFIWMTGKEVKKLKFFSCKVYIDAVYKYLACFGADGQVPDNESFFNCRNRCIIIFSQKPFMSSQLGF